MLLKSTETHEPRYDFEGAGEAHLRNGRLVFYKQKASGKQVKSWVAAELGSIQNVCKQFIQAIRADADTGLTASLGVFDVTDGLFELPDEASLTLGFWVSMLYNNVSRFSLGQLALAFRIGSEVNKDGVDEATCPCTRRGGR